MKPIILLSISLLVATTFFQGAEKVTEPFAGRWAFSLPDGNPAWLKVDVNEDKLVGDLLWSVGSARPVKEIATDGGTLTFRRQIKWKPYGELPTKVISEPFVAKRVNEKLQLTVTQRTLDGNGDATGKDETFTIEGKRLPPIPPKPDLSKVRFGDPINLLENGLADWRLTNPKKTNGWRFEGGLLINETPKTDFGAYGSYGNLRTNREFEDFELSIDYLVDAGGNSGIYLRGMYEAQVVDRDSRMQGINGPGAIFGRIKPSENAANPPGDWNTYKLTLVDQHITVELNGVVVIDNQVLEGCTGGGMQADDTQPGPIFLQGDHTSVRYRKATLRPVIKD